MRTLLSKSRLYSWIVLRLLPRLRFSTRVPLMNGRKFHVGYKVLRPGDILLSVDYRKLLSYLIPGPVAHAALCIGKKDLDNVYEIAEMVASGFKKTTFFDFCHEADRVLIVRCDDWDPDYIKLVVVKALYFVNTPYDLIFDKNDMTRLYCSELIYHSDFQHRLKLDDSGYILPVDLLNADNVRIIFDSKTEE